MGRLIALIKSMKEFLVYIYSCMVLKTLSMLILGEFFRIKRLVVATVNRSRRLRVKDINS